MPMSRKQDITQYILRLKKWGNIESIRRVSLDNQIKSDAIIKFSTKNGVQTYILETKPLLANINIQTCISQLVHRQPLPKGFKFLVTAPYIRKSQADILIENKIDFFDLSGNVHIESAGTFIHIEGKMPGKKPEQYKGRMFQRGGLQILFILLTQKNAVTWPYRKIAEAAGVVHGTVGWVIYDMRNRGFILGKGKHTKLARKKELISLWTQGYLNVLRPKIIVNKYRPQMKDFDETFGKLLTYFTGSKFNFALSGSQAAFKLSPFYKDDKIVFFADGVDEDFKKYIRPSLDPDGTITHLNFFVNKDYLRAHVSGHDPLTHPLITYAELLNDGTDRAKEAAGMFYEKFIKELEDED